MDDPINVGFVIDMIEAGKAAFDLPGNIGDSLMRAYRAMRAAEPTSYDECTVTALSEDIRSIKRSRDQWQERALAAEALLRVEEPGSHDYNGPVADGKTIPDPVHERFHGAIGDVLSGKVMPAARRQMQEALKQAPKDAPTTASTSRPMPRGAVVSDQQSIGLRLP